MLGGIGVMHVFSSTSQHEKWGSATGRKNGDVKIWKGESKREKKTKSREFSYVESVFFRILCITVIMFC